MYIQALGCDPEGRRPADYLQHVDLCFQKHRVVFSKIKGNPEGWENGRAWELRRLLTREEAL